MKRQFIFSLLVLFVFIAATLVGYSKIIEVPDVDAAGGWNVMIVGGQPPAGGEESFCVGGELFCTDYETDPGYDSYGGTDDCNLDTENDYCKQDSTAGHFVNGSYGAGLRGSFATVQFVADITDGSEAWFRFWFKYTDSDSFDYLANLHTGSDSQAMVFVDNDDSDQLHIITGEEELDTGLATSNNTWYNIAVYYKEETAGNNGIMRVWLDTVAVDTNDTPEFDDTGVATGHDDYVVFKHYSTDAADGYVYFDDTAVYAGAP